MFSGIVEAAVQPTKIQRKDKEMVLTLPLPIDWNIAIGDSISVDGVCSTVKEIADKTFSFYFMPETLRKTTFGSILHTHTFNMERPVTLQTFLSGHLVSGHIDTTGKIISIQKESDASLITIQLEQTFTRYIIYKGSIAVNGVSLTIVSVKKNSFIVSLIPYTLRHTNLGNLKIGDIVNIEVDMLAKYIEKLIRTQK